MREGETRPSRAARALEPVRVFGESSRFCDADEGKTRAAKRAPAGVPELARAFERRRGEANEGV